MNLDNKIFFKSNLGFIHFKKFLLFLIIFNKIFILKVNYFYIFKDLFYFVELKKLLRSCKIALKWIT